MQPYISKEVIYALREQHGLTQRELADRIGVTDKAVSKWETGRGVPDIALVEPLARTLGVSVAELLTGNVAVNANKAGNASKAVFYVCPICGNVVTALGEGSFCCCGAALLVQEPEQPDAAHALCVQQCEGDHVVTMDHPMTKQHYLSFMAYVTADAVHLRKLYPEQAAQARFPIAGAGLLYAYCNRHGLFRVRV